MIAADIASTININQGFVNTIQSLWRYYDGIGRLERVTSRIGILETSSTANEVKFDYDQYGQIATFFQDHSGPVNTQVGGSPRVIYTYNYPSYGNHPGLRLISTTYPSGFVIQENYSTTSDDRLNRLSGRSNAGLTFFTNDYLGLNRVLTRHHPSPQIDIKITIDRFKRNQTLKATYTPYTYDHNYFEYKYNDNSQIIVKEEKTNPTLGFSETGDYNSLSMLIDFKLGSYSGGSIPNPNYRMFWLGTSPPSLDHSGNWRNFYEVINGTPYFNDRTVNISNEVTAWNNGAGSNEAYTYDQNGNVKSKTTLSYNYKYDAWNRLVQVVAGFYVLSNLWLQWIESENY